ncbi:MAG: hypothetical protein ACKPKO_20095, partial [Candidatus Fonsibacter sp.]
HDWMIANGGVVFCCEPSAWSKSSFLHIAIAPLSSPCRCRRRRRHRRRRRRRRRRPCRRRRRRRRRRPPSAVRRPPSAVRRPPTACHWPAAAGRRPLRLCFSHVWLGGTYAK